MNKPKEPRVFWIAPEEIDAHGAMGCDIFTDYDSIPDELKPHACKLVEYSAYEELAREQVQHIEILAENYDKKFKKLESLLDEMAGALEFLVRLKNWKLSGRNIEVYERDKPKAWSQAKEVLQKYRDMKVEG